MSRYEIEHIRVAGFAAIRLRDDARQADAVIVPELGCNCISFRTTPDDDTTPDAAERAVTGAVEIFVPPTDIASLRDVPFTGGNPILFPFPNRVRDGVYTFEGQTYRMDKLFAKGWDAGAGQALHGLVGDKPWTPGETFADDGAAIMHASLQLDAFPDIVEQYPFPCLLTVRYTLRDGLLTMLTTVQNTGAKTLPMGFGIHPWFPARLRPGANLPADLSAITTEQRAASLVHVPANAIWQLDKLMPTGNTLPVDGTQYDLRQFPPLADHFFDDVFTSVQHTSDGGSEGGLRDPDTGLEMFVAADDKFREWVLYAPLNSPVIALEPYTCTTDAVNLQARGIDAGLLALPPGQTWSGEIHFGLRRFAA